MIRVRGRENKGREIYWRMRKEIIMDKKESKIHFSVILSNLPQAGKFSLFSASGQLLQAGDFLDGDYPLDLSGYPQGAYFVKLVIGSEIGQFKIVKL